jgi:AraC-like DNA-binding protein
VGRFHPRAAPVGTRVLFRSGGFLLAHHCCAGAAQDGREEVVPLPEIIVVRRGAYLHRCRRGRRVVDPNSALFVNAQEPYEASHPAGPDECYALRLPPSELLAIAAPGGGDDPARPFHGMTAALPRAAAFALHRLARRSEAPGAEPLEIQEGLLAVAASGLRSPRTDRPSPAAAKRDSTRRDHRDRAEAVKLVLARRLGERVELAALAREVHSSPFHLARLFRAATGSSIHSYLIDLRARNALARLADGERDLAGLAFELGFADHAHLTRTLGRRFGATPSALRAALRRTA